MFKHKKIGRWNFVYRNPAKTKWYMVWHPKLRNTPALSLWRLGVWRSSK